MSLFSARATEEREATLGRDNWPEVCLHTHPHTSLIPHLTQGFLRERINLWEQLNHITLCKYPESAPPLFTTVLAPSPMAPLAQKCARGKLTFALIVCKWQLVLAIEMKHWPMQERERENI